MSPFVSPIMLKGNSHLSAEEVASSRKVENEPGLNHYEVIGSEYFSVKSENFPR